MTREEKSDSRSNENRRRGGIDPYNTAVDKYNKKVDQYNAKLENYLEAYRKKLESMSAVELIGGPEAG